MSRPASPPPELRRSLRSVDLVAIGLNATVGSGIFLLPDDMFRAIGPWSPLAFALCALGLLPVAWCFADAAKRTGSTGGPYEYARREFGESAGYGVGLMCFANAVFSFSAVASAAGAYAARLGPLGDGWKQKAFAVFAILLFAGLNYVGARPGALAIRVFTVGKFAVLFLLISVLVPELRISESTKGESPSLSLDGLGAALFMALFALQGFEVVGVPAGEANDPERKVPAAVLSTLVSAAALYVVVQVVLVFGVDDLSRPSDAPLADAALAISPSLGIVVAVGALISTLGFVSGSALGTPRYLFAMGAREQLPSAISRLHPVFGTPHVAILVTSAIALVLVLPFDYRTLIGMSNVAVAVQYAATCLSVARQRVRAPRGSRGAGDFGLAVALAGALVSVTIFLAATKQELFFAGATLVVGVAIRSFVSRRSTA